MAGKRHSSDVDGEKTYAQERAELFKVKKRGVPRKLAQGAGGLVLGAGVGTVVGGVGIAVMEPLATALAPGMILAGAGVGAVVGAGAGAYLGYKHDPSNRLAFKRDFDGPAGLMAGKKAERAVPMPGYGKAKSVAITALAAKSRGKSAGLAMAGKRAYVRKDGQTVQGTPAMIDAWEARKRAMFK